MNVFPVAMLLKGRCPAAQTSLCSLLRQTAGAGHGEFGVRLPRKKLTFARRAD
jgi:hypothetical protein